MLQAARGVGEAAAATAVGVEAWYNAAAKPFPYGIEDCKPTFAVNLDGLSARATDLGPATREDEQPSQASVGSAYRQVGAKQHTDGLSAHLSNHG
jgi:hypothetical protein